MILTPDHLFYSTMLNAYGIPVASIAQIKASTGLLNKGVTVQEKNGTKTKIPCAVETKELSAYAKEKSARNAGIRITGNRTEPSVINRRLCSKKQIIILICLPAALLPRSLR